MYWPMRAALEKTIGPKLPFKSIRDMLLHCRDTFGIRIPRDVFRKKNEAILWMCEHSDMFVEMLDAPLEQGCLMEGDMSRVQVAWAESPEMEDRLYRVFGRKPKMTECVDFARDLARRHGLKVDRQATRSRAVLLAWFVENWATIHGEFAEQCTERREEQREEDVDVATDDQQCCEVDLFNCGSFDEDTWDLTEEWCEPQFFL